ncbi:metalloendopeptidase [Pleosporales sp. CAS-2024a]
MFRVRPPLRIFQTRLRPCHAPRPWIRQHKSFGGRPQYQRFGPRSGGGATTAFLYRWAQRPTFYRDVGLVTAGTAAVYLYNVEEVPVSGRRRFNMIPARLEQTLGQATMDEIKQQYQGQFLPDHDPRVHQVQRVLDRLLPFARGEEEGGLQNLAWELHVIDAPEQNAFVVPGGKVFVFTGILPLCQDEHGIAAVLGHEIAHVVARHTAERMSQAPLILLGVVALSLLDVSFQMSSMLLNFVLSMPASRKQEAEADYIGLMMMAQACYNPEAAMMFWHRMEKLGQQGPPQILSTHPSNHNREDKIREWMPKAWEKAEASECNSTRQYAAEFTSAFSGFHRW